MGTPDRHRIASWMSDVRLSVANGDVVADPFRRTVEAIELLRCHAGGLR